MKQQQPHTKGMYIKYNVPLFSNPECQQLEKTMKTFK